MIPTGLSLLPPLAYADARSGLPALLAQAPDDSWLIIGLVAQIVVSLCFISQLVAYLRSGQVTIPPWAVALGLLATLVAVAYAVVAAQWVLLLAECTNLLAGMQLIAWRKRTGGVTSAHRRPSLPVVAPETADPKSGIFSNKPKN